MHVSKILFALMAALWCCLVASPAMAADDNAVLSLMQEWAKVNYQTPKDDQEKAFAALTGKAHAMNEDTPDQVDAMIWEAIITSTYAGAKGGLGALSLMEQARDLLFAAEKIDPNALDGAIYTTLGSFYYMVPGWPIGFGDDDKALEYLKKGLEIAPDNMDANYFMGDYLLEDHKYKSAAQYFQKVVDMDDVANRPIYSQGRKAEAAKKLEKINKKLH
jgi:tetratricopeptide (TPR) repeat protein